MVYFSQMNNAKTVMIIMVMVAALNARLNKVSVVNLELKIVTLVLLILAEMAALILQQSSAMMVIF